MTPLIAAVAAYKIAPELKCVAVRCRLRAHLVAVEIAVDRSEGNSARGSDMPFSLTSVDPPVA